MTILSYTVVLTVMATRDLRPTFVTYHAMIRAAFHNDFVIDAMKYYDLALRIPYPSRMGNTWKQESDKIVASVAQGYLSKDRYTEAEHFLNETSQNGNWHGTSSRPFVYFILWLFRQNRDEQATNLFEFHKERFSGYEQMQLYIAVFRGRYLLRGDLPGAVTWLRLMKVKLENIGQGCHAQLIQVAMRNGDRGMAETVLQDVLNDLAEPGQSLSRNLKAICSRWNLDVDER